MISEPNVLHLSPFGDRCPRWQASPPSSPRASFPAGSSLGRKSERNLNQNGETAGTYTTRTTSNRMPSSWSCLTPVCACLMLVWCVRVAAFRLPAALRYSGRRRRPTKRASPSFLVRSDDDLLSFPARDKCGVCERSHFGMGWSREIAKSPGRFTPHFSSQSCIAK